METKNKKGLSRRQFVKFMGSSALLAGAPLAAFAKRASKQGKSGAQNRFSSILPSAEDDVVLAEGLEYRVLCSWQDTINAKGDTFGFNNDFLAFVPVPGKSDQALLWANHEYIHGIFLSGTNVAAEKTRRNVDLERYNVGGSLLKIKRDPANAALWVLDGASPDAFRITGTTEIPFSPEGTEIMGKTSAEGMVCNCAGGTTPWGNILTCEENYDSFYGERLPDGTVSPSAYGHSRFYPLPPEHYGWVVEINPTTRACKKLTALGRMAHEGATTIRAKDGRVVVYMGDDKPDEHVYKFISKGPDNLDEGELFVANTEKGEWLSLKYEGHPVLTKHFKNQLDVLIHARQAAKLLGATPLDRPEDIEIGPSGEVFISLTNNAARKNFFGQILKIEEAGDHTASRFKATTFVLGGQKSGLACPDNLAFDGKGNLWVTSDMGGSSMNKAPYESFKHNGLFVIPLVGDQAGKVFQVASAPRGAEFTGPCFSPDGKTLFLSVQHPGEDTVDPQNPTSHWPEGGRATPKPSVIQIFGPFFS